MMENLKGLVLSGGRGTRLRPITHTNAKQLVPVANKPVLFYGLEAMADAGIGEVGIIIAPGDRRRRSARPPATAPGSASRSPTSSRTSRKGLAHAVLTAEPFLGASPFVMYLGDNLLKDGITDLVETFKRSEPDALILLTPVPDPEHYGVAELDGDRVKRLVEKPKDPPSDLALVGVYMFTPVIFEAARAIEPSVARRARDHRRDPAPGRPRAAGRAAHRAAAGGRTPGQLDDILEANRLILEDLERARRGRARRLARRGPGRDRGRARASSASTVRGPAIIGAGSRIVDCLHRPLLGDRRERHDRALRDRALDRARGLQHLATSTSRMEASLIGRNVTLERDELAAEAYRFMVGDNSEIRDPLKVLITGGAGMLGRDVARAARGGQPRADRARARRARHPRRARRSSGR